MSSKPPRSRRARSCCWFVRSDASASSTAFVSSRQAGDFLMAPRDLITLMEDGDKLFRALVARREAVHDLLVATRQLSQELTLLVWQTPADLKPAHDHLGGEDAPRPRAGRVALCPDGALGPGAAVARDAWRREGRVAPGPV